MLLMLRLWRLNDRLFHVLNLLVVENDFLQSLQQQLWPRQKQLGRAMLLLVPLSLL